MHRFVLTDAQWAKIEPLCLGKPSDPGRSGGDNRLFLEAVLWIARTGSPWRDLPPTFGNWNTVAGVFRRIFDAVPYRTMPEHGVLAIASMQQRHKFTVTRSSTSRHPARKRATTAKPEPASAVQRRRPLPFALTDALGNRCGSSAARRPPSSLTPVGVRARKACTASAARSVPTAFDALFQHVAPDPTAP